MILDFYGHTVKLKLNKVLPVSSSSSSYSQNWTN